MEPVWDDRLLPWDRARQMAEGWKAYEETHLRCAMPPHGGTPAMTGRDGCGQSMGIVTPATSPADRVAMTVRHMVMAHDRALSGAAL